MLKVVSQTLNSWEYFCCNGDLDSSSSYNFSTKQRAYSEILVDIGVRIGKKREETLTLFATIVFQMSARVSFLSWVDNPFKPRPMQSRHFQMALPVVASPLFLLFKTLYNLVILTSSINQPIPHSEAFFSLRLLEKL